ncbi:hypothetical protein PMAYCL1PPCAC_02631 [Pristionchus mayeri]|uniref:SHSP domain-containing protein n=1 Tax=Pristionchus mayeri TaxID=1317129 RepID=A0AAN5C8N3_9BILA|nr:hypothetical protein PMAYCL1PPCAC_02631 [Pristionchus mayeri]
MAVVTRRWFDSDLPLRNRDSWWGQSDSWMDDWRDWPRDWPSPRELMGRFHRDSDHFWRDWPAEWPKMDAVMPRFTSHLDSMDRNWREDPFWRDLYPRWAEPIFKEGIDVHSNIVNDRSRFAVDIDCYQFKPEEIQVKTLDDTLMIEGRHEDVRDRDNFTKMYFVRKYQLPTDVDPSDIGSSIDGRGRLTVEARKRAAALTGRERVIPIEGGSKRSTSASPRTRNDSGFSNGYSPRGIDSPMHVDTSGSMSGRDRVRETRYESDRDSQYRREQEIREREDRPYRGGTDIPIRSTGVPHGASAGHTAAGADGNEYSSRSASFFHRSESRTSNNLPSPHHTTMDNDRRMYSPRRSSIDDRAYRDDRAYSPHRVTMENEYRANGEERSSQKSGRSAFDSLRDKFEKGLSGFRSQSRSSSRQDYRDGGYRVDSPSSNFSRRENGHHSNGAAGNNGESRTESVRSVRIERKTQY